MADVRIRLMQPDDVPTVEQICDEAFYDIDVRTLRPDLPAPERRTPERSRRWIDRTLRTLEVDAGGCWVAEDAAGLLGFAVSMVRERAWILATFAIRPGHQGKGIGKRLLGAAEEYGARCDVGLLAASNDPAAVRRYHLSGFALHPQLLFRGPVDRTALPVAEDVREGTEDDFGWMDDLDRSLRGAPHGPDHEHLLAMGRLVIAADRSGYAYTSGSQLQLVAATDAGVAAGLLRECLAGAEGDYEIGHVTTTNAWAVDVAMQARLAMTTSGCLGVRGIAPPAPYLPNGALL